MISATKPSGGLPSRYIRQITSCFNSVYDNTQRADEQRQFKERKLRDREQSRCYGPNCGRTFGRIVAVGN